MTLDESIAAICRIAISNGASWNQRVEESGYFRHGKAVTEERLAGYLDAHGGLVNEWIGLSEDQRCLPSWAILRPDPSKEEKNWKVAYYTDRGCDPGKTLEFDDPAPACAAFIKRMLDNK